MFIDNTKIYEDQFTPKLLEKINVIIQNTVYISQAISLRSGQLAIQNVSFINIFLSQPVPLIKVLGVSTIQITDLLMRNISRNRYLLASQDVD